MEVSCQILLLLTAKTCTNMLVLRAPDCMKKALENAAYFVNTSIFHTLYLQCGGVSFEVCDQ